jgi:hypothetical protein
MDKEIAGRGILADIGAGSYTIGPFSADTVSAYCMLTMIHSAIHVDTAAAKAVGGLTVPTPLLVAAVIEMAPVVLPFTTCTEVERPAPARCDEMLAVELHLTEEHGYTAEVADESGQLVMRLEGRATLKEA